MRAVIYARVSTKGQATAEKVSIKDQIAKGRDLVDARGWILVHEPFIDAGISGQKFMEREALQEMLAFIRQGKADLVIVYDNDRIGRRSSVSQHIFDEMDKYNVQLYSVSQPIEPKLPAKYDPLEDDSGFITRTVTGMTSELFIRRLRRNIKLGRKNRVMRGHLYARVPTGYAYQYAPDGTRKLAIIEDKAAIVRRIFNDYLDGKSMRKIAIELNNDRLRSPKGSAWVSSTVSQILTNAHYYGKTYMGKTWLKAEKQVRAPESNWIIANGDHPPIVSEETWLKAQQLRKKKLHFGKTFGETHLLSGLCKCGLCGKSMTVIKSITSAKRTIQTPYLICGRYQQGGPCERNSYQADFLVQDLLEYLAKIASNPALAKKVKTKQSQVQTEDTQGTILALEKELGIIAQRKEKSRFAYETGADTLREYQNYKEALENQTQKAASRLKQLHISLEEMERNRAIEKHFTELIADLPGKFLNQPLLKQKVLLRSIIERIEIRRKTFHIVFKF